mgnify:CR=1 FL=1
MPPLVAATSSAPTTSGGEERDDASTDGPTGARAFGHEIFPRHGGHPVENVRIVDPAGTQLALDHVPARGREICRFLRGGNHFSRLAIYAAW